MNICKPVIIYRKNLTANGIEWNPALYSAFSVVVKEETDEVINRTDAKGYITVRIKTNESICKAGDMIELTAEVKDEPDTMYYEIKSVTENFKGSKDMWHIKITAR